MNNGRCRAVPCNRQHTPSFTALTVMASDCSLYNPIINNDYARKTYTGKAEYTCCICSCRIYPYRLPKWRGLPLTKDSTETNNKPNYLCDRRPATSMFMGRLEKLRFPNIEIFASQINMQPKRNISKHIFQYRQTKRQQ